MTAAGTAGSERAQLCDLLEHLGPDAPTLCRGWRTRDLAAHLVLRERRLDAAAGLVVPMVSRYTARVQAQLASRPYPQLVSLVRGGPPSWSPQRIAMVDQATNTLEYLVHHEDVRRAQPGWSPRRPERDRDLEVWDRLRYMGRMLARRSPVGLVLDPPNAAPYTLRPGEVRVTMVGPPVEMALYLFGRTRSALVQLEGPKTAVEVFRWTPLGI